MALALAAGPLVVAARTQSVTSGGTAEIQKNTFQMIADNPFPFRTTASIPALSLCLKEIVSFCLR